MNKAILVVGGGFAGLTAAIEAAELGCDVYLVEKTPFLGGRVAQLNKYFPKLCPPSCGLEIQFQRIRRNPRVRYFTQAEVTALSGSKGAYSVNVRLQPRHTAPYSVDMGLLASLLQGQVPNDFDCGLSTRKALYRSMPFAFPARHVLDTAALTEADAALLRGSPYIDMNEQVRDITLDVGAVVLATGWKPYDVTRLTHLGGGRVANCVTNLQLERLGSPFGPTGGRIVRPSDGRVPQRVAFVQCAGSRDENHLPYCSAVCCRAALKQAQYVAMQNPDVQLTVFYIDLRTPGRYMNILEKVEQAPNVRLVRGKVARVWEEEGTGNVLLAAEDAFRGERLTLTYDLVVLGTGMQPTLAGARGPLPLPVALDSDGFVISGEEAGIFAAGCARAPLDVMGTAQSATAAALKAVRTVWGR